MRAASPQGGPALAPPPPGAPASEGIWGSFLDAMRERSMRLWGTLHTTEFVGHDEDGALVVKVGSGAGMLAQVLRDPETQDIFKEVLSGLGVRTPQVRLEGSARASAGPAAKGAAMTPQKPAAQAPAKGEAAPAAKAAAKPDTAPTAKAAAKPDTAPAGKPEAAKPASEDAEPPQPPPAPEKDTRSMGQLFKEEPMLQKALDMFDGEVLP